MVRLRRGKTKSTLENAINCALLAVEIYNKPRAPFRVESFITHMVMAWTKLLHAYFQNEGVKYFYKEKNGRYSKVDGENKAWELSTCINKCKRITDPEKANIKFFIGLRNKIEHRCVDNESIGISIFGECQSLLYNFENRVIDFFGEEYALNESLAYSLQFSRIRDKKQIEANKMLLETEVKELREYIENYRKSMPDEVFNSQEYSIKLIQIPKISNTNKSDLAIEFVNWSNLSEEDKLGYEKVVAIVKDKVVKRDVINPGKLKPGQVISLVNDKIVNKINQTDHKCIAYMLSIRPFKDDNNKEPFDTNPAYCNYDEPHKDYLYNNAWVDFLIEKINSGKLTRDGWISNHKNKIKIDISLL